jgi:hypothetical protein
VRTKRDISDAAPDGTDRIIYRMVRDPSVVYILERRIVLFGGEDVVIWHSMGKFNFRVVDHIVRNAWRTPNLQTWDHDFCRFITGPRVRKRYETASRPWCPAPLQDKGTLDRNWGIWRDMKVNGLSGKAVGAKHGVTAARVAQITKKHSRHVEWHIRHRGDHMADYPPAIVEALYGVEIIEQLGCAPYMRMPDGREVQL